ncbi:twin-arginine translocase subunit TatC [Pseudomonadota bacterium]|nr:twin-arginine translocase subunit TatC [Pseudomonadota bacterium]
MAKVKKSEQNMTLLDHLIELRNRLLISFCAFIVLFCLCFIKFTNNNQNLADIVYIFLQAPLASQMLESGGRMIYTALHEGFFTQVKVAFFVSLCISLPVFLIQIWSFVAPGLYKNEKKAFLPFLLATPILFLAGAAMVYYVVIPLAWDFFLSFQVTSVDGSLPIELEPRISEYLSLIMKLIFAFGLCFELPVILLLLVKAEILTSEDLASKRKYAILCSFIVAAILTPPDVISQILLALPIIALYEISIIFSKFLIKK